MSGLAIAKSVLFAFCNIENYYTKFMVSYSML